MGIPRPGGSFLLFSFSGYGGCYVLEGLYSGVSPQLYNSLPSLSLNSSSFFVNLFVSIFKDIRVHTFGGRELHVSLRLIDVSHTLPSHRERDRERDQEIERERIY
jgi:hypothetical protein